MIRDIKQWYQRRRAYKETYRELNSLTNYELKDLGIDRSMITRVALEAAYGKDYCHV